MCIVYACMSRVSAVRDGTYLWIKPLSFCVCSPFCVCRFFFVFMCTKHDDYDNDDDDTKRIHPHFILKSMGECCTCICTGLYN